MPVGNYCIICGKPWQYGAWFHCLICNEHGFASTKGNGCTACANAGKFKITNREEINDLEVEIAKLYCKLMGFLKKLKCEQ